MSHCSKLNWVAAGEIYPQDKQDENIVFARTPQTAIAGEHFLLLSGARDYGIVVVDLRIGVVVFHQLEHQGETVGVLSHGHCVFIVTLTQVLVYCLVEHDTFLRLLPMPAIVAPSSSTKKFTGVSALDAQSSILYVKMSDGAVYDIYALHYNKAVFSLLHSGEENYVKAVTHIFNHEGRILGMQGHIGVACELNTPTRTLFKIHDRVHSIASYGNYMVTAQRDGQSVVVWTPDASRNDQYEISLRQMFPSGQNAVVHLHGQQLIVVHPSASLLHVFEVTAPDAPPSELVRTMRENALHAHIERSICRRIESVETQTVQQIASTFIGNVGGEEDFIPVSVELPVKKQRLSFFEAEEQPSSFYELLDPYFQASELFAPLGIFAN